MRWRPVFNRQTQDWTLPRCLPRLDGHAGFRGLGLRAEAPVVAVPCLTSLSMLSVLSPIITCYYYFPPIFSSPFSAKIPVSQGPAGLTGAMSH